MSAHREIYGVGNTGKTCISGTDKVGSVTRASARSVNADGLQFVAPGIGDRSFAAVSQHDRRAVGGAECKKLESRRDLRRLRKQFRYILGTDLLHIGDMAFAQARQRLGGDISRFKHNINFSHGLDSSVRLSGRVRYSFHYSCSFMAIVLTIFSGSGRARSIDNNPFFRSAPSTCIPPASTKVRWKWRAAMPRWMYCRAFVVLLAALSSELVFLTRYIELVASKTRHCERDAQPLGLPIAAVAALDVVGRITVGAFNDAIEYALDLVESQKERTG